MPHYFASDVHLRHDRPDRDRRFRAWLEPGLTRPTTPGDRRRPLRLLDGPAAVHEDPLTARASGPGRIPPSREGRWRSCAGNHDEWLCPFYERELGARIIAEPHDMTVHGLRLRLVHGHRLGARALEGA